MNNFNELQYNIISNILIKIKKDSTVIHMIWRKLQYDIIVNIFIKGNMIPQGCLLH